MSQQQDTAKIGNLSLPVRRDVVGGEIYAPFGAAVGVNGV
jgi:hypothetical protein